MDGGHDDDGDEDDDDEDDLGLPWFQRFSLSFDVISQLFETSWVPN